MKPLAILCATAVLAAQSGCARSVPRWQLPEPPSEAVRASVGRLAVVTAADLPTLASTPIAGACTMSAVGALAGMGVGLAVGLEICSGIRGVSGGGFLGALFVMAIVALGLAVAAAGVLLGGLFGGLDGAFRGRSSQEVEDGRRAVEKAVARAGVPELLRCAVLDELARETDVPVGDPAAARTLLVIEGPTVGFAGPRRTDPPLRLYGEVRFRLVRRSDGAELHAFTLGFRRGERSFAQWTANEAQIVREEVLAGTSRFAERAVEELFRLERP